MRPILFAMKFTFYTVHSPNSCEFLSFEGVLFPEKVAAVMSVLNVRQWAGKTKPDSSKN